MYNISLEGQVAFVTGGSKGIGQAISRLLAQAGADIVTASRTDNPEFAKEIRDMGRKYNFIAADFSDRNQSEGLIDKVLEITDGQLDILVNNSGQQRQAPCYAYKSEEWDFMAELMLNNYFILSRDACKVMKDKRKGKILNRVGIEKRPKALELRARYGDWEVDLIEGSKGSGFFLSLYERKSHTGLLVYMKTKRAKSTAKAIIKALRGYRVRTLTYDNGLEFANHEEVSKALGSKAYFCNPYHSWEKGGVENYNGLVRQYYPKGSSFSEVDIRELARVEKEINERPRETLMFKSPSEFGYYLRV
jgi:NAD(P)-dependent dehydrogenase (short-subunit alcohol dehydrogenase family)